MSDVVKYFHSGMAGAPQMSNGMGQMISVLDNCLINGFNSLTPSGIARVSQVATATFGTAHGYEVDQVLLVSGCDQTAYNGEVRVLSVPTSTTLTYAVVGTPTTPATSATAFNTKAAPLGFAKIFSGTNKAAYQSTNVASSQWCLRLDGTAWTGYTAGKGVFYKVDICRSMTDIDTMVENTTADPAQFGLFRWYQTVLSNSSTTASTNNINWALYGNDKVFYFEVACGTNVSTVQKYTFAFGELETYKQGDAYNCMLIAHKQVGGGVSESLNSPSGFASVFNTASSANNGCVLAKTYTGVGNWVNFTPLTVGGANGSSQSGQLTGIAAVNPQDYSVIFFKCYAAEASGVRGRMYGMHSILNQLNDLQASVEFDGQKYTQTIGGASKTFRVSRHLSINASAAQNAYIAYDITGPW